MVPAFKRSKILLVGISSLIFSHCQSKLSNDQPEVSIVYNINNCLECNRYVPQNIKQMLPPTAKHIRLYVKEMRDIEANQIVKSLELPPSTVVISDDDSLIAIRKQLPLTNLEGSIGWRSVLIDHTYLTQTIKYIDAVEKKNAN